MAEQIDNDIEQVISMVPRDGEETCEPCKVDNNIQLAVGWCETCDEQLCSDCYKIHCRPTILRNHQLMSLEEMENRKDEKKIMNICRKPGGHRSSSGSASISRVTATSSACKEVKSLELVLSELGKRLTTIEEKTETSFSISQMQHDEVIAGIHAAGDRFKTLIDKLVQKQSAQAEQAQANNIKNILEVKETNEYISNKLSIAKEMLATEETNQMKHLEQEAALIESMLEESEQINNITEYEFVVNPELATLLEAFTEIGTLENIQDRNIAKATEEVVDEFEVRRFEPSSLPWSYCNSFTDAIQMSTDRDIRLLYVILYPCLSGDTNVQLSIAESKRTFKCDKTHASKGEDVMAVKVVSETGAHGIKLLAGHRYTIAVTMKGSSSCSGKNGESEITVEGVKFSFSNIKSPNGTSVTQGQIPGFRFSLL